MKAVSMKFALLFGFLVLSAAFQARPPVGSGSMTRPDMILNAWSLPSVGSPFGTWYQECDPTARRTIYDDSPFEYNYVPLLLEDDWSPSAAPFLDETLQKEEEDAPRKNRSPLRFAARLARRIRRRD